MTVSQWGRVLVDEIERAEVPSGELWIWPLGGPSLCVRSSEATVYIDPYTGSPNSGPWLRLVAVPFDPADLRHADAVFSTHDHDDHCHEATLRPVIDNTTATLIGPASSARKMLGFGFPKDRIVSAEDGDTWTFGDMTVRAAEILDHSDPTSLGYVITVPNGPVFCDAGDSMYGAHFAKIGVSVRESEGRSIDAAALSIADLAAGRKIYMSSTDLIQAARDLGVRILIPKHWDLWRNVRLDPWEVVVEAQRHNAPFRVHIPRLGEVIKIEAK